MLQFFKIYLAGVPALARKETQQMFVDLNEQVDRCDVMCEKGSEK